MNQNKIDNHKLIGERKTSKTKITITITLIVLLTFAASIFAIPITKAHEPPWTIANYS